MCALYAFSRQTDDLADSDNSAQQRCTALELWRQHLLSAFDGDCLDPLLPALVDTIRRYNVPRQYLFDIIDGVEMDLGEPRYESFDELCEYCHRVASAVGLVCLHIWGFKGESALEPAMKCGVAFQLTNILRDLREDAARGRVYLPLEDLNSFEYTVEDLFRGVCDERFTCLVDYEVGRTERLYQEASSLLQYLHADGRRSFWLMFATYRKLLLEIKRRNTEVLSRRIRLSIPQKMSVAVSAILGPIKRPSPRMALKPLENRAT